MATTIRAAALYSGGLDSILACRLIMAQGIEVSAVKYVTPFFDYHLLENEAAYVAGVKEKYGIDVRLIDISEPYVAMVANPPHGYGKNFNPCLDCKIMMLAETRRRLPELGSSFIITGEVVGQRPMSQRLDTLRVISRDSGCEGLVVRPLCGRNLPPTKAEVEGLLDRNQLLDFQGRDRKPQIGLAARFGITDFPNPAGGCVLTDPNLAKRIARYYREHQPPRVDDLVVLMRGRQFVLPGGGWLIVGRTEVENEWLLARSRPDDWQLTMVSRPGPVALLRYSGDGEDLALAAGLVVRYGKKVEGQPQPAMVEIRRGEELRMTEAAPLADAQFADWLR